MKGITVVLPHEGQPWLEPVFQALSRFPAVRKIFVVRPGGPVSTPLHCKSFTAPSIYDGRLWNRIIGEVRTTYLLLVEEPAKIDWGPKAPARLIETAETTKAGMVYSDYGEQQEGRRSERPVNDYQPGSLRDDFHFGPVRLLSVPAARSALKKHGAVEACLHAGLYDLRLKVSMEHTLFHLQECLYTRIDGADGCIQEKKKEGQGAAARHFAYVDPRNVAVQREMEKVATAHLKRIGAWLKPEYKALPSARSRFPVEASVIIPVRNRRRTVADAVRSALSQKTDFPFNVICVDNHSTDGTTRVLSGLARKARNLKHLIPRRTDLGIGGCWNEAIYDNCCGRFAVQLDSDDLYSGQDTLQKLVDLLRSGDFAMVIGSYTLVDESLRVVPPGLIDHREWTDDNGRNNALRINGLGAPRAFQTALVRRTGFLNVSYGEDYAMALRLSREYRVGRIYESLYLCRRWGGNTDAGLSVEKANRNDAFKDRIRTLEIMARQAMHRT